MTSRKPQTVALIVIFVLSFLEITVFACRRAHAQFGPPSVQFKGTLPTVIGHCVTWDSTNGQYVTDPGACPGLAGLNVATANGFRPILTGSPIPTLTMSFDPALSTGLTKNTAGVVSIATNCSDYYATSCFSGLLALQPSNNVNITGGIITGLPSPTNPSDAATKGYVDSTELALNPAIAVQAATITVLPNSPAYNNGVGGVGATLIATTNGALVIDGYSAQTTDRLLIKNQASTFQNGIYSVSATGNAGAPYTLARVVNFDTVFNINAIGLIPVYHGTTQVQTSWTIVTTVNTVGTDPITFAQYGLNPSTGVTGPGSSTTGDLACWNGATGTILSDCGMIQTPAIYVWNSTDPIAAMNFTVPATWTGTTTLIGVATEIGSGTFTYTVAANGANATGCTSITATHATTPPATIATCTANNTATQGQDFTVTISAVSTPVGPASIGLMLSHAVH